MLLMVKNWMLEAVFITQPNHCRHFQVLSTGVSPIVLQLSRLRLKAVIFRRRNFCFHQGYIESFILFIINVEDTVCTNGIVQVGLGDVNGDFSFKSFLLNRNSNVLEFVCRIKFCWTSDNCFEETDAQCDEGYTKNK